MKIYTIKDIAKLANVGISTVSRVINNRPDVNTETRNKVLQVMEAYHYTPNANAKHLKSTSTEIIGLIVKGYSNLFFAGIVESIQKNIEDYGYIPLVHYIDELDNELETAKRIFIEKKVKGLIFLGGNISGNENELKQFKIPCVLTTSTVVNQTVSNVSSVSVDDRAAAKLALDYLFNAGHRKIAVIGGRRDSINSIWNRFQGVLDSFEEQGEAFNEKHYIESKFSLSLTYEKMSAFLSQEENKNITAIFAMSDIMALGAAKAISDHGYKIPDDISIIGFDGIEIAQFYNPSLATIKQPAEEIAKHSVELIINSLHDKFSTKHIILPVYFEKGKSVKTF